MTIVSFCSLQAELTFSAGDIITVFGSMDDDGFYYVSIGVGWVLWLRLKSLDSI